MTLRELWTERRYTVLLWIGVIALLGLSIVKAYAAGTSATLSWVHPVAYTNNGGPLALTDIKETAVQWRRPGNTTMAGNVRVAAPATTVIVSGLVCGDFVFTAATVLKANNVTSEESASAAYTTGVVCTPNPPTAVTAQ